MRQRSRLDSSSIGRWSLLLLSALAILSVMSSFGPGWGGEGQALAAELSAPKPLTGNDEESASGVTSAVPPSPTAKKGPPAASTRTPRPTSTLPAEQTASSTPTATPQTTATSVTPTHTPSPTSQPTFTPTPTPTAQPALTGTPTATPTVAGGTAQKNDDFDAATVIASFPYIATQDTSTATSAADDPDMHAGAGFNSNTVWFSFVAPTSGSVTVSTVGSSYDTVLAAFTGSRGNLAWIDGNDDANPSTLQSEVAFNIQAGTTYYVEAAQYDTPGGGSLRLSASLGATIVATSTPTATPTNTPWPTSTPTPTVVVGPAPQNDNIGSATVVNRLPFSLTEDTTGATSASDDPDMGGGTGRNSNTVWFRLATAASGSVRVTTRGSNYDTVLAVFSGYPGSLTLVASNDDVVNNGSAYDGTSEVVFNALAGVSYFVEAAQYSGPGGGQLHLTIEGGVGIAATPSAIPTASAPAVAGFPPAAPRSVVHDNRFFSPTGYRIDEDAFWDFFQKRGGVRTFGYPVSWEFTLLGFKVQIFQRGILQLMPSGSVAAMNLLDDGLMPYTRINSAVFPGPDRELIDGAPSPSDAEYSTKAIDFLRQYVPDEWDGRQVNFLNSYLSTVRYEDAFPNGEGDPALLPLLNLEMLGLPTSKPAYDPGNRNFVYQRFQRGILHYDASTGATQGLLLADYLKSIITGQNLPADLDDQARGSHLYRQYVPGAPRDVARPQQLPGTDLAGAFVRDPL